MLNALTLTIALMATWFLWSGYTQPLLLSLGLLSVALVLLIGRRMGSIDEESVPLQLGLGLFTYWGWLIKEIIKSNIAVVRIVLDPRLPISPTLFKVKALQPGDLGQVIFANSITLTPGTVSTDIHDGIITVHALTAAGADDVEAGEMNRRVAAISRDGRNSSR